MFCCNCGNQLNPNAVVCVACGTATPNFASFTQAPPNIPKADDKESSGWSMLGFFMMYVTAIVPLVLICVWRSDYPKRARSIFHGVLASLILNLIAVMICGIIFLVLLPHTANVSFFDDSFYLAMWWVISIYAGFIFFAWAVWSTIVCVVYAAVKR